MSELRRLLPVVAFSLGIALVPPTPSLRARALLALLAAAVALLARTRGASSRVRRAGAATCAGLALAIAGGVAADHEDLRYRAPLRALPASLALDGPEGRQVRLTGRFATDPEPVDAGRLRAIVVAETLENRDVRAPFPARIQMTWPSPAGGGPPPLLAGVRARMSARLRLPRSFGNPGSYDMTEHLERRDTLALGWIKSARLIETLGAEASARGASAGRHAPGDRAPLPARLRRRFDAVLRRLATGPDGALTAAGSVLRASVLGGRTGLDPETERRLVASGVYHLLAVSGLQVAILATALLGALRRTPVPPRAAVLAAASTVLVYGATVAPSPSVGRAVTMAVLAASARLLHRRTPATSLLGLAAFVRLTVHPSELGDPGFQLTFAATAGILLFGTRLVPHLRARAGTGPLLAASLAAQGATWPLVALWFHRVVPFGLAANLLAVPLGSAAVVLGVLLLPADLVSAPLADALGALALLAVKGLLAVAQIPVEGTPLSFRVASPSAPALALAAAGLLGLVLARRRACRIAWALLTALACLLVVADPFPRETPAPWPAVDHGSSRGIAESVAGEPSAPLGVDLIDVGQGDAILVRFANGETMLVDGGGFPGSTFDVGARVLVPELERRGLRRIGRVVLTHAHEDHGGGLREVLRSLDVDELLVPDAPQGRLRAELEALARTRGVRVLRIRRGYTLQEGETRVLCLAPFPGVTDGPNADSVVLRIESGGGSALLTGDIVAATERRLLAAGLQPADILKVAHHGSDSSSLADFLGAVSPRVALISVGEANRFGHPSPRVLARLAAARVHVLRTDRDGAVRVDARGAAIVTGSLLPERPSAWPGPPLRPRAAAGVTRGAGSGPGGA